jgi:hypothetical protein
MGTHGATFRNNHMAATKRRPTRPKKPPKIRTERPPPDDPAPVRAWRYGDVVVVETDHRREVLTPAECRTLAAILLLQGDLADRTPSVSGGTRQLPDE